MIDLKNGNYRNVHYESDIAFTVRVAKTLLTPIGIWPLRKTDTTMDRLKLFAHIGATFTLMCFLLVPHVIYTFHDAEDLTRYMKVIAAQVFSLLAIIKFWTIIINKEDIRYCLLQMEIQYRDIQCEEDRTVMINSAQVGRFFTTLYLGLSYGGALPYHIILPLMSERVVKGDNTTQIPLPYLSNYIFFVIQDSPLYEITFVSQIFISSIILSTNCGIYSMIATIATHCCGLFEVVSRQIETMLEYKEDQLYERFKEIIRYHLKAIEFAEMIENALSTVFLSEMLGCTVIICFLEYGVLTEWSDHKILSTMTYVVLMTSIFVNVFIIAFIGDRLKQEVRHLVRRISTVVSLIKNIFTKLQTVGCGSSGESEYKLDVMQCFELFFIGVSSLIRRSNLGKVKRLLEYYTITIYNDIYHSMKSARVGETSYFVSWYDLPENMIDGLKMIILRTSRPTNLTAAKLFDVSLLAFCDVCKTSAAYLNFLRAMTE